MSETNTSTAIAAVLEQIDALVQRFVGDPSQGEVKVLPPALHELKRRADVLRKTLTEAAQAVPTHKLTVVVEAARQTIGCKAVVLVAIDDQNAQTVIANHSSMPVLDVLFCAAGSIHLAQSQVVP